MKIANRKGFTMVELLIVLAIIAILAAVAIPVYSSQLENARKEVDNSNLRAATGLAAQDFILREAGKTTGVERYYVVLTYDKGSNGAVNSSNMLVYPAKGKVTVDGTWYEDTAVATGGKAVALTIPADTGTGNVEVRRTMDLDSGKPAALKLQQNSGNARFVISIAKGGIVSKSQILLGSTVTVK